MSVSGKSIAEQLQALYTPEQLRLLSGVSSKLHETPHLLDTHKKQQENKDGKQGRS